MSIVVLVLMGLSEKEREFEKWFVNWCKLQ